VASSTEGAFPRPVAITEAEWRSLLTAVVGPLRAIYGEGPQNVPVATGVVGRIAENTDKLQPVLVTVQVSIPIIVAFGRAQGVTLLNGLQHNFMVDLTFRQVLLPGDQLYALSFGVDTTFIVYKTLI
jgi:hypothetical protein